MPPVCTRLSEDEIAALDAKAASVGAERSGYVRDLIRRDLGLAKRQRSKVAAAT